MTASRRARRGTPTASSDERWRRGLAPHAGQAVDRLRAEGVAAGPVLDDADAYADPHLMNEVSSGNPQADTGTYLYPGALHWFGTSPPGPTAAGAARRAQRARLARPGRLDEDDYRELEADGRHRVRTEIAEERVGTDEGTSR